MNQLPTDSSETQTQRKPRAQAFLHEAGASKSPENLSLRAKGGWAYQGMYWALLELLMKCPDYRLKAVQLPGVALDFGLPLDQFTAFLDACCECELIVSDQFVYWSPSLCDNMSRYEKRAKAASLAGSVSAKNRRKSKGSRRVQRTFNERSTNVAQVVERPAEECSTIVQRPILYNTNTNTDTSKDLGGVRGGVKPEDLETLEYPPQHKTPEVLDALRDWLAYKRSRNEIYKTVLPIKAMLKAAKDKPAEYLVFAIHYAISRQWQGVGFYLEVEKAWAIKGRAPPTPPEKKKPSELFAAAVARGEAKYD